jgi:hypothetical protein
MRQTPYRFVDSPVAWRRLCRALAQVGLTPVGSREIDPGDGYRPSRQTFVCPWLAEVVELEWHFRWWPDGEVSELARVVVRCGGQNRGELDVSELLGRRFNRPLETIIIDWAAAQCEVTTGKRVGGGAATKA